MQMDKNDMKIKKSVSMHWRAFKQPCKRQIVTDTKLHNASHIKLFHLFMFLLGWNWLALHFVIVIESKCKKKQ